MFSLAIDISKTCPSKNLRTKMNIPDVNNVLKEG